MLEKVKFLKSRVLKIFATVPSIFNIGSMKDDHPSF